MVDSARGVCGSLGVEKKNEEIISAVERKVCMEAREQQQRVNVVFIGSEEVNMEFL